MQTSTLLIPIVQMATEHLTEAELEALNDAAQASRDPHSIGSYPTISDLFTENGGGRMHRETRLSLGNSRKNCDQCTVARHPPGPHQRFGEKPSIHRPRPLDAKDFQDGGGEVRVARRQVVHITGPEIGPRRHQ